MIDKQSYTFKQSYSTPGAQLPMPINFKHVAGCKGKERVKLHCMLRSLTPRPVSLNLGLYICLQKLRSSLAYL